MQASVQLFDREGLIIELKKKEKSRSNTRIRRRKNGRFSPVSIEPVQNPFTRPRLVVLLLFRIIFGGYGGGRIGRGDRHAFNGSHLRRANETLTERPTSRIIPDNRKFTFVRIHSA